MDYPACVFLALLAVFCLLLVGVVGVLVAFVQLAAAAARQQDRREDKLLYEHFARTVQEIFDHHGCDHDAAGGDNPDPDDDHDA